MVKRNLMSIFGDITVSEVKSSQISVKIEERIGENNYRISDESRKEAYIEVSPKSPTKNKVEVGKYIKLAGLTKKNENTLCVEARSLLIVDTEKNNSAGTIFFFS